MTRPRIYTWQHAVCESDLQPTTRLVLFALGTYMNQHGESCYPSVQMICDASGLGKTAVIKHLGLAEKAGFLSVSNHGFRGQKWKRNEYCASFPKTEGSSRGELPLSEGGSRGEPKAVREVNQDKNSPYTNPIYTQTRASADVGAHLDKAIVRKVQSAWNAMAEKSGLDPVQLITPDRLRFISRRLENVGGDPLALIQAIDGVPHDPHRTGHSPGGWRATFDWVFKSAETFTKCLESQPRHPRDDHDKYERSRSLDAAAGAALASMGVGPDSEIPGFRPTGHERGPERLAGGRALLSGCGQ